MRGLILKCDSFNSAMPTEMGKYFSEFLEQESFYRTCLINYLFN